MPQVPAGQAVAVMTCKRLTNSRSILELGSKTDDLVGRSDTGTHNIDKIENRSEYSYIWRNNTENMKAEQQTAVLL